MKDKDKITTLRNRTKRIVVQGEMDEAALSTPPVTQDSFETAWKERSRDVRDAEDTGQIRSHEAKKIARKGAEHEALMGRFGSPVERGTVDSHIARVDLGLRKSGEAMMLAQRKAATVREIVSHVDNGTQGQKWEDTGENITHIKTVQQSAEHLRMACEAVQQRAKYETNRAKSMGGSGLQVRRDTGKSLSFAAPRLQERGEFQGEEMSGAARKLALKLERKEKAAPADARAMGSDDRFTEAVWKKPPPDPPCLEDFCAECPVSLACWAGSLPLDREKACVCPCCRRMVVTENALEENTPAYVHPGDDGVDEVIDAYHSDKLMERLDDTPSCLDSVEGRKALTSVKSKSMQEALQGNDKAYREASEMFESDDVLMIDNKGIGVWTSEPRGDGDGGEGARMGLFCPARCAVLEESIVDRWQMAFYRQGIGACLMLVDPGPTQKVNRLYVRMCADCVEAYLKKVGPDMKKVTPNGCNGQGEMARLLQAMLELGERP